MLLIITYLDKIRNIFLRFFIVKTPNKTVANYHKIWYNNKMNNQQKIKARYYEPKI